MKNAFVGIRACVCALILDSVIKLAKKAVIDVPTLVIAIVVFLAMCLFDLSPIILVVAAALAGIIIQSRRACK